MGECPLEELHLCIGAGTPHADWPVRSVSIGERGLEPDVILTLERTEIARCGQVTDTELRSDLA